MKNSVFTSGLLAVLLFVLSGPALSQDFDVGVAAYERGDYGIALREFKPLAEQGSAPEQYNLGVMYTKGQGVPQNHPEALRWFRLAADQGLAPAEVNLGVMYAKGRGVPQNYDEAIRWYRIAAEKGNVDAQYNLGEALLKKRGDVSGAYRWFLQAAKQGDADAQYGLGLVYAINRDQISSHMWFNISAVNGKDGAEHARADRENKMSLASVSEAQRRASVCLSSGYHDCE